MLEVVKVQSLGTLLSEINLTAPALPEPPDSVPVKSAAVTPLLAGNIPLFALNASTISPSRPTSQYVTDVDELTVCVPILNTLLV